MPKRTRTLSPKQMKLQERRERVLELYSHDVTIRQIAEHLNKERVAAGEKPISFQTVHNDLIAALNAEAEYTAIKRRHHIQLILKKLQRIESTHIGKLLKATSADEFEKYTRGFDRIWSRYDAILGTRKPVKLDLDPRQSLAKLLGRSPEELPNGDSDA